MTLDDIAPGSSVLIDANILIYARRGMSAIFQRTNVSNANEFSSFASGVSCGGSWCPLDGCVRLPQDELMLRAEIFREIQGLPVAEQFEILEALARLLRQQFPTSPAASAARGPLAAAAAALRADYQTDPDLTAFTALDAEDFHATR